MKRTKQQKEQNKECDDVKQDKSQKGKSGQLCMQLYTRGVTEVERDKNVLGGVVILPSA